MLTTILNDFIERGMLGKSDTTVKTYAHALQQFEKWLEGSGTDLEGFGRADVQQYINYLAAQKKSAATINKVFNAIKTFSRWSGKKENIEDVRVVKPKNILQEAPKALSKAERCKLIRDIDRSGNKRNFAIIMLGLNTGIRLSELVALDRSDIDISDRKGMLTVRNGKGSKERVIPINAETRRALTRYLEERTDKEEALLISNRYQRISPRMVQTIVENEGFNFHQFRHSCITELVRSGVDISIIQSMTGHSSADMILRYSMPSEEDKAKAVERLFVD
jgi:integrase/recombinase XerD